MNESNDPLPVEGMPTQRVCPRCNHTPVLLIYRRLATIVLFCPACENVWTARPQNGNGGGHV